MRAEVERMLEMLDICQPRTVLNYGPLEGSEVQALVETGWDITAFNVLGKTPVDGARYVQAWEEVGDEYDAVVCAHVLACDQEGFGQAAAEWILRRLKPGGMVVFCVPVGVPGSAPTRKYGRMRVLSREMALGLFQGCELETEFYLDYGQDAFWDDIDQGEGISCKEIVQVGIYAVVKPRPQDFVIQDSEAAALSLDYGQNRMEAACPAQE